MTSKRTNIMQFTGEYFLPGKTENRIQADHYARYTFAREYVKSCTVLDLACGEGYGSKILDSAAKYVGVDINSELIADAQTRYASSKVSFEPGNAESYSNELEFDVITSFETIEHVENYSRVFKTYHRCLKNSGTLLLSTPNRTVTSPRAKHLTDRPNNPYHTQEFLLNELKTIVPEYGFQIQGIFGQRQSRLHSTPFTFRRALNKVGVKLDELGSHEVTELKKTPRYYVLVCKKV